MTLNPNLRTIFKIISISISVLLLILLIITSVYFLAKQKIITLPDDIAIQLHLEPPIKEQIGKFIILPHLYNLSENEIKLLSENRYKTIFIIDGNDEDKVSLTNKLGQDKISSIQINYISPNSEYKLCNSVSEQNESKDSKTEISIMELLKGDCDSEKNIISTVTKFVCRDKISTCQNEFIKLIHDESTYVFFVVSPFTQTIPQIEVNTEQIKGSVIVTWDLQKLPQNLIQKSYSLEYLDADKKRISAFGKMESGNQGDNYLPPINLKNSNILIKLRIWYQFNGEELSEPIIYLKTFEYEDYQTEAKAVNSVALGSTNPVEMAWIPDWGVAEGISTIQKNPAKWNTISPTWYVANADGTLAVQYSNKTDELNNLLRANNIKIVPTIMLFEADTLKVILREKMQVHIDEIVSTVVADGYDGIDLDYESTYADDKELLTKFVTELAIRLHEKGKILSFTAVPKIDSRKIYPSMPQTHFAQDWVAIGAVVDEFRIMAYDYTPQANLSAGPLSPLPWNEAILEYATNTMPASKVVLALPIYSHAWNKVTSVDDVVGVNNDKSLNSGGNNNTSSWQHEDITYIKTHGEYYNETVDLWYGEMHAFYKYNGIERDMYYLSPAQINQRLELAKKYGIKGLCYWRIGGDNL